MAALPYTGLETHPAGTANVNGIINANWQKLETIATTNGWTRASYAALTYAGTVTLDFAAARTRYVALTGTLTVAFSNLSAGADCSLILTADASSRALTWPASIIWLGTAPTALAANKSLRVHFFSQGTTAAAVFASFDVQP